MKQLLRLISVLITGFVCSSCTPAPTTLILFAIHGTPTGTAVEFTSQIEFEKLHHKRINPIVHQSLVCPLNSDVDFSFNGTTAKYARGDVEPVSDGQTQQGFRYRASVNYFDDSSDRHSSSVLTRKEIIGLLAAKKHIACKVLVQPYFTGPYYSKEMYLPVAALLNALPTTSKQ